LEDMASSVEESWEELAPLEGSPGAEVFYTPPKEPRSRENSCFGGYTYGSMDCEVTCRFREECREVTGDAVMHIEVAGVHPHVCEECGRVFQHLSSSASRRPLCINCIESGILE